MYSALMLACVVLIAFAGLMQRRCENAEIARVRLRREWLDELAPFMDEAQREVDALLPGTPAIAAPAPLAALASEAASRTAPRLAAALPSAWCHSGDTWTSYRPVDVDAKTTHDRRRDIGVI